MDVGSLISVLLLGLVAGAIARMLVPGDAFRHMSGPKSWGISIVMGLLGSLLGYWVFRLIGIGDTDKFDWGGIIGAVLGAIVVVVVASMVARRTGAKAGTPPSSTAGAVTQPTEAPAQRAVPPPTAGTTPPPTATTPPPSAATSAPPATTPPPSATTPPAGGTTPPPGEGTSGTI